MRTNYLFLSGLLLSPTLSLAADCSALEMQIQSPAANFSATLGTPITLSVKFLDGCNNPIVSGKPDSGQVEMFFTGATAPVTLSDQGNGIWQASWTAPAVSLSLTLTIDGLELQGTNVYGAQATVTGSVAAPPPPSTPPVLAAGVQSIALSATQGGNPASQQVEVQDTGGGSISFSVTASSSGSWLSVTPASGTAAPAAPSGITVSALPGSLAAGSYTGAVAVSGAGSTVSIPVTFTVAQPPASIALSQTALSFSAVAQGAAPSTQSFSVSNAAPGALAWSAAASTSSGGNWLQASPSTGTANSSQVTVSVNPSGLSAGTYQGTVAISSTQAANSPQFVNVTLTVTPQAQATNPAALAVDTSLINLTGAPGGPGITQQFHVLDTGGGSVSFTAAVSGASWLTVSPASGTATPTSPATVNVTASPAALAAGVFTANISVTGAGTSVTIPVTFTLNAPQTANILLSETGLNFAGVAQGGNPLPENFTILNTSQGAMNWTAAVRTISGGNWLQITPASGTVQGGPASQSSIAASVNISGLAAGTYYGQITVTSPQAVNSPQVIAAVLTLQPPGANPSPQVYPSNLTFFGSSGANPTAQSVSVANLAGDANGFESGSIGSGFTYLPLSATLPPSQPTSIEVAPNFSKLAAGAIERGTITLQFDDGSPSASIGVTLISPSPAAASCSPLLVSYRAPQGAFAASVGQPVNIEAVVYDSCGNPVEPGGSNPHVSAFLNNTTVAMTHIGSGIWQTSWTPSGAGPGLLIVSAAEQQGSQLLGGETNAVLFNVQPPPPESANPSPAAVVHAASQLAGAPVSPGELITIYGQNMASAAAAASSTPFPLLLLGTEAVMGATPIPLLYVSSGQINAQVPYSVPVNTQYQVSVENGTQLSSPQTVTVAAANPGVFTVNQAGTGQGIIVKSDGITLAQAATPALIGETIVIYCTGLGAVNSSVVAGEAAPSSPLAQTVNPVIATIGGLTAQVTFAGLTPGFVGLYQVNAVVPAGVAPGSAVPVTLTVAGQTSPAVTIAVAANE